MAGAVVLVRVGVKDGPAVAVRVRVAVGPAVGVRVRVAVGPALVRVAVMVAGTLVNVAVGGTGVLVGPQDVQGVAFAPVGGAVAVGGMINVAVANGAPEAPLKVQFASNLQEADVPVELGSSLLVHLAFHCLPLWLTIAPPL